MVEPDDEKMAKVVQLFKENTDPAERVETATITIHHLHIQHIGELRIGCCQVKGPLNPPGASG